MQSNKLQSGMRDAFSRRRLIQGTALAALAGSVHAKGQDQDDRSSVPSPGPRSYLAYIGTYTGAIGGGGNGEGIYLYKMNAANGHLSMVKVASMVASPSWIALNPSQTHLYAVNEISNFNGGTTGSVSSFAVNKANGDLNFLNVVSSGGAGPAHLSVDTSGKFVLVANYGGGDIAVIKINTDGSLGATTATSQDVGSLGPTRATSAPPGSFAISGHDAPHAHMVITDPSGKYLLNTDLGQDRIYTYNFNNTTGALTGQQYVNVPPGDGPRHLAFHPNGKWLYSIQEEGSTIAFFHFDPSSGMLMAEQTISTLPRGFTGTNYTSEIMLSPDSRFVYAANRLHDTIAVFSIDNTGGLTWVSETSTLGDYPRSFNIDPSGNFMYVCNQRSDAVTCFRIDKHSGMLTSTGEYTPVGSPARIIFMA